MIELKGYLTNFKKHNESELIGEWVAFPIDEDELEGVLKKLGINNEYKEYSFTDYECDVPSVCHELDEHSSIEKLNELAKALEGIDDEDLLAAAIELGGYSVMDIIENIDDYSLRKDIHDDYDLGYDYVADNLVNIPDYIQNYIDYEGFGSDLRMDAYGEHTKYGWIERL